MLQTLSDKKLYFLSFYVGLLLLGLSFLLKFTTPIKPIHNNHSHIKTTIIALELSTSVEQIRSIVGNPEDENFFANNTKYIQAIYIDFFYIAIYGLFFWILFEIGSRKYPTGILLKNIFYLFLFLSLIFDVLENIKLLIILESLNKIIVDKDVHSLSTISLTKWISIYILCGIIGLVFWLPKKNYILKAAGLFLFIAFMLSLFGIFKLHLIEVSAFLMSEGLIITFVHIVLRSVFFLKNSSKREYYTRLNF